MTIKPVILRVLAEQDIEQASLHYLTEASEALAMAALREDASSLVEGIVCLTMW